jgi:prokaryotic YEATS domain
MSTDNSGSSSSQGEGNSPATRNRRALLVGSAGSLVVLAGVLALQADHASILRLPSQWLALAAIPVIIGLVVGGYLRKFSFAGIEVEAPPLKPVKYVAPGGQRPTKTAEAIVSDWTRERQAEYERTHFLEMVHIYKPSARPGQKFDISIYIMRHVAGEARNQITAFTEIDKVEFFFGPSWGNRVFTAPNDGGIVGLNTSAFGSFLATCRIVFNDGSAPVVIHRYIDFEMAQSQSAQ